MNGFGIYLVNVIFLVILSLIVNCFKMFFSLLLFINIRWMFFKDFLVLVNVVSIMDWFFMGLNFVIELNIKVFFFNFKVWWMCFILFNFGCIGEILL